MRILTVVDKLSVGGRQRTAQDYTLGYQRAGLEVAVLALQKAGPRLETLRQAGVPVFLRGHGEEREGLAAAIAWKPDVIHLHSEGPVRSFEADAVEAIIAQSAERPVVLETASFGRVDYRQRYTETDVHLLKSTWVLWRWKQWTRPLQPAPIGTVVPNMVDETKFFPASAEDVQAFRERLGLPRDAVVFGCLARPDPLKWPLFLFAAFEQVAKRHPRAHLLVAGLTDDARERVAAYAPDVRRRVVELPFIHGDAALRTCYSALDVFLHGSPIGETFGLVFVEALLCGTPVITHCTPDRHNSQLEVVGHGRGGLIAGSERYVASAMEQLLTDPSLRRRLASAGAAHAKEHYTEAYVIPLLLRIINHARQASSRQALAEALRTDPATLTSVDGEYVEALLSRTLGPVPFHKKVLMKLVHRPELFRTWWAVKGRLLRVPDTDPVGPSPLAGPAHA